MVPPMRTTARTHFHLRAFRWCRPDSDSCVIEGWLTNAGDGSAGADHGNAGTAAGCGASSECDLT